MIWATRPVIAARADFLTLCSCEGDGRGRHQHPPQEPLQISVGCVFVSGWVAVYVFHSDSLPVPFHFQEMPLSALQFLIQTEPENTKCTTLYLPHCFFLCVLYMPFQFLVANIGATYSNVLLIDYTVCVQLLFKTTHRSDHTFKVRHFTCQNECWTTGMPSTHLHYITNISDFLRNESNQTSTLNTDTRHHCIMAAAVSHSLLCGLCGS